MKRILIVDDDESIRILLSETLSSLPVEIQTASNVKDAKEILSRETIDLVSSDNAMTGEKGVDLLRHVRTHFPETHFVMVTASIEAAQLDEIPVPPPDFALEKPFDIMTYLRRVSDLLGI